jgi:hypothetical protein
MAGDPRECRQRALHCLNLAKTATTPQGKAKFLELADHWSMLARDLEELKVVLKDEDES